MGRTLRSPGHLALMAALKQARLDAGLTQTDWLTGSNGLSHSWRNTRTENGRWRLSSSSKS